MQKNRFKDWFAQAEDDFLWMEDSFSHQHFSQTCFIAQQVAEKSLKALALFRGVSQVWGHSVVELARELGINSDVENAGKILDLYYISARYPDALPSGYPGDRFSSAQAEDAKLKADLILRFVRNQIGE